MWWGCNFRYFDSTFRYNRTISGFVALDYQKIPLTIELPL